MELQEEIWKHINKQNVSKYLISNKGRIKNYKNQIILPEVVTKGYNKVRLNIDTSTGKRKRVGYFVHELMAVTFLENPNNCKNIIHIDGDLLNNNITNLKWDENSKIETVINSNNEFHNEIWKLIDIDDTNNEYEISNFGRVRNRISQEILKPYRHHNYLMTNVIINNKTIKEYIHILVAKSFLIDVNNGEEKILIHKDGNKFNNKALNLEWVSRDKNIKPTNSKIQKKKKSIIRISINDNSIVKYASIIEACRENNTKAFNIKACLSNKQSSYKGFKWKYNNE